jgi:hypothetical protein
MADNKDTARKDDQQGGDTSASGSGHYSGGAGAGTSRGSGFVASAPEANVFPAGAAQADHGSAGGPVPGATQDGDPGTSAAGTPDEGRLGGSGGTSASGTTGNDPDR